MRSRSRSTHASGSRTTRPLTLTRPAPIQLRASVRDPRPALERTRSSVFSGRLPGGGLGMLVMIYPQMTQMYTDKRMDATPSLRESADKHLQSSCPVKRLLVIILLLAAATTVCADETRPEYRAYWVDTFRTPFATRVDVDRIVEAAVESNANALFVQVRRRGDAWYLDAAEPRAEAMDGTFDPLRTLLDAAHARGIQVHAFVIVGAIFHGDPKNDPLPRDPRHVFLQHFWDAARHQPYRGARQWGTKTSKGRYPFPSDWYLDLGHPEAAAYTVDVLLHLVRAYDIDGIHLDRVRYPESPHA